MKKGKVIKGLSMLFAAMLLVMLWVPHGMAAESAATPVNSVGRNVIDAAKNMTGGNMSLEGGDRVIFSGGRMLEYTLDIQEAGLYRVEMETSLNQNNKVEFLVNGKSQGTLMPLTQGTERAWHVMGDLLLPGGKVTLTFAPPSGVAANYYLWNFALSRVGESSPILKNAIDFVTSESDVREESGKLSFQTNHYATYDITVPETGIYVLRVETAGSSLLNYNVSVDGAVAGGGKLRPTGNYNTYQWEELADLSLTSGNHKLKITAATGGNYFRALRVEKKAAGESVGFWTMAMDYQTGFDKSKEGAEGQDSSIIAVESNNLSFSSGDWAAYSVNVSESGMYRITTMNSSDTSCYATLDVSAGDSTAELYILKTAGWNDYRIRTSGYIYLEEGKNTIRFAHKSGSAFYFSKFKLEKTAYNHGIFKKAITAEEMSGASIEGNNVKFVNQSDSIGFRVIAEEAGLYSVAVQMANNPGDDLQLTVSANGNQMQKAFVPNSGSLNMYSITKFGKVWLSQGENMLYFTRGTGTATYFHAVMLEKSETPEVLIAINGAETWGEMYAALTDAESELEIDTAAADELFYSRPIFEMMCQKGFLNTADVKAAFENALAAEDEAPHVVLKQDGESVQGLSQGDYTVEINFDETVTGAVVCAVYENNSGRRLVSVGIENFADASSGEITLSGVSGENLSFQLIMLDGMNTLKPVNFYR